MKKTIMALTMSAMLLIGSFGLAQAKNLVTPPPIAGQYLAIYYSPSGGALAVLDEDNDGECDKAIIYGFLKAKEKLVPIRIVPCEDVAELVRVATKYWESLGYRPMVYDKDKGELVPVED